MEVYFCVRRVVPRKCRKSWNVVEIIVRVIVGIKAPPDLPL
jgi:hypothetical protein